MTSGGHREGAGFFIVNPSLDRVLVLEAGEYLDVPRGLKERNETLLQTAFRETWSGLGLRLEESDLLTQDCYRVGNLTMFLVLSGKKPVLLRDRKESLYVPWRTLEENCEQFLISAVEWAKEKSYG